MAGMIVAVNTMKKLEFCPLCIVVAFSGLIVSLIAGLGSNIACIWLGATIAIGGNSLYNWLKKLNGGKPLLPFGRPAIIALGLILASLALL